jgi:hypothetical protein
MALAIVAAGRVVNDPARMLHPTTWLSLTAALCLILSSCADLGNAVRSAQEPEVTFDGLDRVRGALVGRLWVRHGASLEGKTKILPRFGGFSYKTPPNDRKDNYSLTQKQVETLEAILHEVFREELTRDGGWEITDTPGPDVIKLRAWLVDVVVKVPPDTRSARDRTFVAEAGEATLVVEIFDSESRQILARVADRASAQKAGGGMMQAVQTENRAAVRRMFRHWAKRLRSGLDEVKAQGTFEIR